MDKIITTDINCPECLNKITEAKIEKNSDLNVGDVYQPFEIFILNNTCNMHITDTCPVCKSKIDKVMVSGNFAFNCYRKWNGGSLSEK